MTCVYVMKHVRCRFVTIIRGRHLVVDEQLQMLVLSPIRFGLDKEGLKVAVLKEPWDTA